MQNILQRFSYIFFLLKTLCYRYKRNSVNKSLNPGFLQEIKLKVLYKMCFYNSFTIQQKKKKEKTKREREREIFLIIYGYTLSLFLYNVVI